MLQTAVPEIFFLPKQFRSFKTNINKSAAAYRNVRREHHFGIFSHRSAAFTLAIALNCEDGLNSVNSL